MSSKVTEFYTVVQNYIDFYEVYKNKENDQFKKVINVEAKHGGSLSFFEVIDRLEKTKENLIFLEQTDSFIVFETDFGCAINTNGTKFQEMYFSLFNSQKKDTKYEEYLSSKKYEASIIGSLFSDTGYFVNFLKEILFICSWVDKKINVLLALDEGLKNEYINFLSKHKDINEKLENFPEEKFKKLVELSFGIDKTLTTIENIKSAEQILPEIKENFDKFKISGEILQENLKQTEKLMQDNKVLSTKLASKEMSGTFHDASEQYTKTLNFQWWCIVVVAFVFAISSIFIMYNFNIETIIGFKDSPLALVIYTTPKIVIFIICSWVLKFLMSEYKNNSRNALDFKHKQAIADTTPAFRSLVDENSKNVIVSEAFSVLLKKEGSDDEFVEPNVIEMFTNLKSLGASEKNKIISIIESFLETKRKQGDD